MKFGALVADDWPWLAESLDDGGHHLTRHAPAEIDVSRIATLSEARQARDRAFETAGPPLVEFAVYGNLPYTGGGKDMKP